MGIYMIKDAAKELDVEAHVLRYWEEELGLTIKRNSMGHRYYDEKDIMIFKNVQELKKRGLSLKDIRDGIEKAKKEQASIKKSRMSRMKTLKFTALMILRKTRTVKVWIAIQMMKKMNRMMFA